MKARSRPPRPLRVFGLASLALIVAVLPAPGCAARSPDRTPEGTLDAFLQACEEAPHDRGAALRALALLAPESRRALEQRAQRATAVLGRPVTAAQLLVPGFGPLRFEVARTTTKLSSDGATAVVEVYGPDPATQHASVPMVREGAAYRVALVIPP